MSRFLSSRFSGLEPYVPGEQPRDRRYIKLNTNESPYPPAPQVIEAISAAEVADLRLYSDPACTSLKRKLAQKFGMSPENIFVGNGSDEVLSFIFMAFCDEKTGVSYPDISYGFYPVYANLYGLASNVVPLREDFTLAPEDYSNLNTTIVFANPNAPTGMCLSVEDVERIVRANPDNVVAVDEAYVDFGGESCAELTKRYDNLIVTRTFSKSHSLAGARLGFAVADSKLIGDLERLRNSNNPYNVNSLTLKAGEVALEAQDYYDNNNATIIQTRDYFTSELRKLGFSVLDSKTNFVFAGCPKLSGEELYLGLKARGILVRFFKRPRLDGCVRITIGSREQMDALLKEIKELIL